MSKYKFEIGDTVKPTQDFIRKVTGEPNQYSNRCLQVIKMPYVTVKCTAGAGLEFNEIGGAWADVFEPHIIDHFNDEDLFKI